MPRSRSSSLSHLRSGAPYWYWLGGRPALDLVNTRRERWRRNVECLTSDRDAADWLVAAQLLPAPGAVARGLVREAQELREAIDAGVRAAVAGEPTDAEALRVLDDWLARRPRRRWCSMQACGTVEKARRHRAAARPAKVPAA